MLTTSRRIRQALAVIALSTVALTGCYAEGTADTATPYVPTPPDSQTSTTPSDPSNSENSEVKTPEGYQMVTAEQPGVTFAIPADWQVYSKFDDAEIDELSRRVTADPDALAQQTPKMSFIALSPTRDINGVVETIHCTNITVPTRARSGTELAADAAAFGGTLETHGTVETPNGTATYAIYHTDNEAIKRGQVYLPNKQREDALIQVTSGTVERVQELLDNITSTAR